MKGSDHLKEAMALETYETRQTNCLFRFSILDSVWRPNPLGVPAQYSTGRLLP